MYAVRCKPAAPCPAAAADDRLFAQCAHHRLIGRFPAQYGRQDHFRYPGIDPRGDQRRYGGDHPVRDRRDTVCQSAEIRAGHPGDLIPAQLGEHVDRILRIRPVDPDRLLNRGGLSFQSGVRQARPPSGHCPHGQIQQGGGHCAGGRRVSDAHFPDHRDLISPVPKIPDHILSCLQCLFRLLPGHGGPFCDIGRALSDPPADRPLYFRQHAHIDRQYVRVRFLCHQVDVAGPFRDAFCHQRRYFAAGLADAFPDHAVIAAEHQRAAFPDPHVWRLLNARDLYDQILQPAQGMQGFRNPVPAPARLFLHVHSSASSMRRTTALISSNRLISRP